MKKNIDFAEYLATNGKYFAEIDKKKRKEKKERQKTKDKRVSF